MTEIHSQGKKVLWILVIPFFFLSSTSEDAEHQGFMWMDEHCGNGSIKEQPHLGFGLFQLKTDDPDDRINEPRSISFI